MNRKQFLSTFGALGAAVSSLYILPESAKAQNSDVSLSEIEYIEITKDDTSSGSLIQIGWDPISRSIKRMYGIDVYISYDRIICQHDKRSLRWLTGDVWDFYRLICDNGGGYVLPLKLEF